MYIKIIYLLLLIFHFSSCQWTSKIEKGVIIMHTDSILPNYSYKGYDISPFAYYRYVMPYEIGEEFLVLYQKEKWGFPMLEKHQIVDTITVFKRNNDPSHISIPVFEDGTYHKTSLDEMLFFKGFNTYNTNHGKNTITNEKSGMEKKGDYDKVYNYHSWKVKDIRYCYTDMALIKKNKTEISFSINSKEQILIRKFSEDNWPQSCYELISATDLDGDGISDIIIRCHYDSEFIASFFLFLSSEAEEGELLKHVATNTFLYKNRVTYSEEDWADFY